MRKLFTLVSALALVVTAAQASATTITFNSDVFVNVVSFTEQGVTFSAVGGGGMISTLSTPNGTTGLLDNNTPRKQIRADIAGGTTSVSVDLGDFDADADLLVLSIFNSSDVLLGTTSLPIDAAFSGMLTLSLSAPGIAYATFGSTDPSANGSSVFADNFTFAAAGRRARTRDAVASRNGRRRRGCAPPAIASVVVRSTSSSAGLGAPPGRVRCPGAATSLAQAPPAMLRRRLRTPC